MLEASVDALFHLFSPGPLLAMLLVLPVALFSGLMPGGGLPVSVVVLSLAVHLDPWVAITIVVFHMAASDITEPIPAILFGVPGSRSSQATVLDGYPMAQQGLAGVALGASYTTTIVGGVVGAAALLLSLPVSRQILEWFGSAEFFLLTLMGGAGGGRGQRRRLRQGHTHRGLRHRHRHGGLRGPGRQRARGHGVRLLPVGRVRARARGGGPVRPARGHRPGGGRHHHRPGASGHALAGSQVGRVAGHVGGLAPQVADGPLLPHRRVRGHHAGGGRQRGPLDRLRPGAPDREGRHRDLRQGRRARRHRFRRRQQLGGRRRAHPHRGLRHTRKRRHGHRARHPRAHRDLARPRHAHEASGPHREHGLHHRLRQPHRGAHHAGLRAHPVPHRSDPAQRPGAGSGGHRLPGRAGRELVTGGLGRGARLRPAGASS